MRAWIYPANDHAGLLRSPCFVMHYFSIQKLKAPTARQTVTKTRTSCQIYLRLSLCQSFWLTCLPLSTTLLWCHAPLNPSPHISFSIPKNRTQSQTHLAIAIAFAKFLGQIVCFVRRVHFFPSFRGFGCRFP